MNILNYFFIGFFVIFIIDVIIFYGKHHPLLQTATGKWGNLERITCVLIWPIAVIIFVISFIKQYFKK